MKRFTIDLAEDLYKQLKFYCVEHDTNMVEVIRKLLEDFLAKEEKKPKK
jgi:metal-responsive CopG/Arc/MetJ family transcriptional regulator